MVYERGRDGAYGDGRRVDHVRFERKQSFRGDGHCWADAGAGTLFMDAVNSPGAYEVPAGSRIEVNGRSYLVRRVSRLEGARGRAHHWELELS